MPPALRLGAVQHVVGEEAEIGRGGDLAGQIASEGEALGDDVEGAAGGEGACQDRRGMLSKVRLAPALSGTMRASWARSIPALSPISSPSRAATKLV